MTHSSKKLTFILACATMSLSLNSAFAEDAKPVVEKKGDALDGIKLSDPEVCETAVSNDTEIAEEGAKFINTLGADGVRRVGVPRKMGVVEVIAKDNPEYYAKYYSPFEPRAKDFAAAMMEAAKNQTPEGAKKLNEFLEKEIIFQITAHMDKILKSKFMTRAIYTAETSKQAGELVGKTVQELIDELVKMDPKIAGSSKMKARNLGRAVLKNKFVGGAARLVGLKDVLNRQVESMVTGQTAVEALNNRLDSHIAQLTENLKIFDDEDKYYREQAENCRHALAYSILADNMLRDLLKTDTIETDGARALLIEQVMLPMRRKIMGLRARLVQLDAVMAERIHHRKNYRRIMEEAEEVRAVGILVIAGTISNHHATQDARAASAALKNARTTLNAMMQKHAEDFQSAMQEGREAQKEAILSFETAAKMLNAIKEEMKNEALHGAETVNQLPEVARIIELTGMELGELRNQMQKGADIAALIEDRQLKTQNKDAADQANEMGKMGWDFFKRTGGGDHETPVEKPKT